MDLTPDAIRIYIPKEYPPNSCEYDRLVVHEQEHERLHRRRLQDAVDKMRLALSHAEGLPGPHTPIKASSPQEAYARLKTMVDRVVRPIYDDFLEKVEMEQQTLDDPQHYRQLGEGCSGWLKT